jgi:hypothetical protein
MELVTSPQFEKSIRQFDRRTRELIYRKLELFLQNKQHPSLRYKTVHPTHYNSPKGLCCDRQYNTKGPGGAMSATWSL